MDKSKFRGKYRIETTRYFFSGYNMGRYFITICTKDRNYYFGNIQMKDGLYPEMNLSEIGRCVDNIILNISEHHPYASIPIYVIMPNHIHLIVCIYDGEDDRIIGQDGVDAQMQKVSLHKGKLSMVIGGMKSHVTRYANEHKIPFAWQPSFYDRIIRRQQDFDVIASYIKNNVINWGVDEYNNDVTTR